MWYLTEECSPLESLISPAKLTEQEKEEMSDQMIERISQEGPIYRYMSGYFSLPVQEQWNRLSDKCCKMMAGAP
jgi:hypothetical protein